MVNNSLFWFRLVQAGVDLVAELVGVTLGPKGRNVVLQNKYGPPKIVNDGETILKEVTHNFADMDCPSFLFIPGVKIDYSF